MSTTFNIMNDFQEPENTSYNEDLAVIITSGCFTILVIVIFIGWIIWLLYPLCGCKFPKNFMKKVQLWFSSTNSSKYITSTEITLFDDIRVV